jgi:hypothetical protein
MRVPVAFLIATLGLSLLAAPALAQDGGSNGLGFDTDCEELTCSFTAHNASSSVNGTVDSYAWTIQPTNATGDGEVYNHTFDNPGNYNMTLEVTGEANSTASHTESVTVDAHRVSQETVPWAALGVGAVALVGSIALARAT